MNPLLVMWRTGRTTIPGGYQRIGDVRVVVGKQADAWRGRLAQLPQWSHPTAGGREAVEAYVERYDAATRGRRSSGFGWCSV